LASADEIYSFGPFMLDAARRTLRSNGDLLPVGNRAFDLLLALLRRDGRLAAKSELMDIVWRDVAVEENNLNTQVLNLRKLLAAHDAGTRYIVTDAGRGYRFVSPVARLHDAGAAPRQDVPAPDAPGSDAPPPATARPQVGGTLPELHNLPQELNSFVGRAQELADIASRLGGRGMLTLVGAGGVGKTRCAVRIGHQSVAGFADGVWLAELAPLAEDALVAEAVCYAVGAPVSGELPAVEVAVAFLRQRNMLVILDNCEHVLGGAAELAAELMKHCAGVKLLATSRQRLGIAGETVFRMPSLPLPPAGAAVTAESAMQFDAVRLFVARARDIAGGYRLTDDDAPAVVSICRQLDGVAMATELAAARLRILKPAEIATRLADVFRLLTDGSKTALPRQQTLRATIDWSYALLSPDEQSFLCRLSVFVDGFSMAGAGAVGAGGRIDSNDVLDLLGALVDKSLVNADTSGPATRYRMLETTRQYAREKLAQSSDTGRFRKMAEYMARFFARAETSWPVTPTQPWLAEFAPEMENLRAAIDWAFGQAGRPEDSGDEGGDPALGIALVAAAGSVAEEMSLLADMKRWTAAAMPHLDETTPKSLAGWVLYWATRHQSVFGVRELSDLRRRAIQLFREAGDAVGLSCALRSAGIALARPGEGQGEAVAMLAEAIGVLRPLGQTKDLANALAHLGGVEYLAGNKLAGRRLSEEALAMRRALGDQTGELISYINLGEFAFSDGEIDLALDYARRALGFARVNHVHEIHAAVLNNYANYLLAIDDPAGAREAAEHALQLFRALGTADYAVVALEHLALVLALEHRLDDAARLYGFTDAYYRHTEQVRDPSEQLRLERLARLLSQLIPPDRLAVLLREGAAWSAVQADAAAAARLAETKGHVGSGA
jgi:predicted ATPase/DNA-binding winged helix-turn-helix (wHTH) protein